MNISHQSSDKMAVAIFGSVVAESSERFRMLFHFPVEFNLTEEWRHAQ